MHNIKSTIDHFIEKCLIVLETIIAIFSVLVLVALLLVEVYHIVVDPTAFLAGEDAVTDYLHHMLTIVIGLEFVKLLMHFSPANIVEVLIMAISRGIIVSHGTAVDNLLSILCIVGLFAAKRYLIPRSELHKDMDEEQAEPHHHHRGPRRNKHRHDHEEHKEHAPQI